MNMNEYHLQTATMTVHSILWFSGYDTCCLFRSSLYELHGQLNFKPGIQSMAYCGRCYEHMCMCVLAGTVDQTCVVHVCTCRGIDQTCGQPCIVDSV